MRTFSIYENAGGNVKAVKNGFRFAVLVLTFCAGMGIIWAIWVRFWWLVALNLVGIVASSILEDSEIYFWIVVISSLVAIVKAEDWEVKRLEKLGYTFQEYVEGDSGSHAIGLFRARKNALESRAVEVGRWPPGTAEVLLLVSSMELHYLGVAHPWSLVAFVAVVIVVVARERSRDRQDSIEVDRAHGG